MTKKSKKGNWAKSAIGTRVVDAEIVDDKPVMTFAVNFLSFEVFGTLKFDEKGRMRLKVDIKDGR